jgi:hypothetical protein
VTHVPRPLILRALQPFIEAIEKAANPVADSDLYDEQPRTITVTLGDCRTLETLVRTIAEDAPPASPKVHPNPERFLATLTEPNA